MGHYLKGYNMAPIQGIKTEVITKAYNFCFSKHSTKFTRMFKGQYLKGNNMGPKKS